MLYWLWLNIDNYANTSRSMERCEVITISRRNIFEIVNDSFDLSRELSRMKRLFEEEDTVDVGAWVYTSILNYVDSSGFSEWKNRGRCVDADDFLSLLRYETLWDTASTNPDDFFTLVELIYNFWYITDRQTCASKALDEHGRNFVLLKTILDDCLAHYGYKGKYFCDCEQLIVIEDKPEATAVAEIVSPEHAPKVLRYNHFTLKGDLQAKRGILLALGSELEPKRQQLRRIDSSLEDDIFFMLNNLHIRHNNKTADDKYYRQVVADMDNSTLEHWYDELYQMMLLAYLQLDQVGRNEKVRELKQTVSKKQVQQM